MRDRSHKLYLVRRTLGFMFLVAALLLAAGGQGPLTASATLVQVSAQATEGDWPIPAEKYLFIERWIEVYQDSAVSAHLDFPTYRFDRESGALEPEIVPPGRWFPLEDLAELRVVYGRGTERSGSAGIGVNSQVFALTALPFTEPPKGDTDVLVTVERVDAQGIVYLWRGHEQIVLRPGESWTRDGESTVEWGGIRSQISSRERISHYGVLDKSGLQAIKEAGATRQLPQPVRTKPPVVVPLTPVPAIPPTVAVEAVDARAVRDAALTYIVERYGEQAPAQGLAWTEEFIPERPFRLANYQYAANDWIVSISYRTRPVLYQVVVTSQSAGYRWEGTVDPSGQVMEQLTPDDLRTARDTALAFLGERYPEQAPALDLTWAEERSIPEVWSGSGTYRYTAQRDRGAEEWMVQVYYPMLPLEPVACLVTVGNRATEFHWEAQVDAAGGVTERLYDVLAARDAALAYLSERYGERAPAQRLPWREDDVGVPVPEGPWGATTLQYTYVAGDWAVYISQQFLAPKPAIYKVGVNNLATHFHWQGEVDAAGRVTEE